MDIDSIALDVSRKVMTDLHLNLPLVGSLALLQAKVQCHVIDALHQQSLDKQTQLTHIFNLIEEPKTKEFWLETYSDGVTEQDIANELSDYYNLIDNVPKVYDHVTGGQLSKANYPASTVIAAFDDHVRFLVDDQVKDEVEALTTIKKTQITIKLVDDNLVEVTIDGEAQKTHTLSRGDTLNITVDGEQIEIG